MLCSGDVCNVSAMKGSVWERQTLPSMWAPNIPANISQMRFSMAGLYVSYSSNHFQMTPTCLRVFLWILAFLQSCLPPSRVADIMSSVWWTLGLWRLATSALGQTWHHLLLFWFNHWELKNQWKLSGHRHLASGQVRILEYIDPAKIILLHRAIQEESILDFL